MATDVLEAAQFLSCTSHQQQWLTLKFRGKEVTRVCELMAVTYNLPGAGEDPFFLSRKDTRVGIKA